MKESMEAYMDDANFYDIRIVSTLGLTDDDVSALSAIDGVKDVQPAYNADLLVQTGDDTVVARAHSLPITTGKEETEKHILPVDRRQHRNECAGYHQQAFPR